MPDLHEVRTANGETRQWDGARWQPVNQSTDHPQSFGWLDYVPGLRDALNIPMNAVKGVRALTGGTGLTGGSGFVPDIVRNTVTHPVETAKGFVRGASEAATPGRVGLLALLTGGATLPAALAAAGGESLAEAGKVATDSPEASESFPEAGLHVAEAAAVPGLPAALGRIPDKAQAAKRVVGAGLGGYEGYKYGGVPGAVAGTVAGFKAPDFMRSPTLRALASATGVVAPEEAAADIASNEPPEGVVPFKPNRSGVPVSSEVRGFSMPSTKASRFTEGQEGADQLEGLLRAIHGDDFETVPNGGTAPGMAIPGLSTPQGTWTQLEDGNWGVKGSGLQEGQSVNVSTSGGTQRLMQVDKITGTNPDGSQIATLRQP